MLCRFMGDCITTASGSSGLTSGGRGGGTLQSGSDLALWKKKVTTHNGQRNPDLIKSKPGQFESQMVQRNNEGREDGALNTSAFAPPSCGAGA